MERRKGCIGDERRKIVGAEDDSLSRSQLITNGATAYAFTRVVKVPDSLVHPVLYLTRDDRSGDELGVWVNYRRAGRFSVILEDDDNLNSLSFFISE